MWFLCLFIVIIIFNVLWQEKMLSVSPCYITNVFLVFSLLVFSCKTNDLQIQNDTEKKRYKSNWFLVHVGFNFMRRIILWAENMWGIHGCTSAQLRGNIDTNQLTEVLSFSKQSLFPRSQTEFYQTNKMVSQWGPIHQQMTLFIHTPLSPLIERDGNSLLQ